MAWWCLCVVCCLAIVVGMDPGAEGEEQEAPGPACARRALESIENLSLGVDMCAAVVVCSPLLLLRPV